MKRRPIISLMLWSIVTFVLTVTLSLSTYVSPSAAQKTETALTVSSGAGLKEVMEEIEKVYLQKEPNVNISYNFAASGSLRRQIEQGAPIDVVVLASKEDMDALQSQNLLLADTRRDLMKSRVALIVPQDSKGISRFQDLTNSSVKKIAIGEPKSVPIGKYAEEVFNYFGILEQVRPKIVYTRDALQILSYVEMGNVDAGITHDTTVKKSNKVRIVAIAPEQSHAPVIYPVAVLKESKNISTARGFVQFLFSSEARSIFEKNSYTMVK